MGKQMDAADCPPFCGLPPVFLCTGKERRNESGTGFHDGKPFPTANCDMIEPGPVVRRLEVSG